LWGSGEVKRNAFELIQIVVLRWPAGNGTVTGPEQGLTGKILVVLA